MVNSSPEVGLKLVEEILINFEKNLVSKERDTAEDLAWALWSLTETEDEERIDKGVVQSLKWFKSAPPVIQGSFIYHVNCLSSFTLVSILCLTAVRHGIPFPSHLLTENAFSITNRTPMVQHMMGMGTNSTYNLGITSTQEVKEPRLIQLPEQVKKVQMSTNHTIFLTVEGNIYGCGKGSAGQLGSKNKCLVVTCCPSLVFEGGEDNPVVDIVVGDGFSAFVTDKKIHICGKFGLLPMGDDGFFSYRPERGEKFASITVVDGCIRAYGQNRVYSCCPIDGAFKETAIYHEYIGIPQTSRRETVKHTNQRSAFMGLAPFDTPTGNKYKINVEYKIERREPREPRSSARWDANILQEMEPERTILKCYNDEHIQIEDVLFCVNGLIVELFVYSFNLTVDGQVKMIASSGGPKSRTLYSGQAKLVPAWQPNDFQFVGGGKNNRRASAKNYNVFFFLEEFPNSHGVTFVETSPDGKNMIYLIDKDPYLTTKQHTEVHEMHYSKRENYKRTVDAVDHLNLHFHPPKAVLNIELLNKEKKEYMDPIPMDIYVPRSLDPFGDPSRRPNARLDFIRALYPDIESYIKDGTVCIDKKDPSPRRKTIRDYLLLAFLNGHDVIPPVAIKYLYAEMFYSEYKKTKRSAIFKSSFEAGKEDYSRHKLFFAEFLGDYLGEIGLRAEEILPNKYLLRSIYAEFYIDYLTTNVAVATSDGFRLPYNWEILCLQSDYFGAAMFHMVGDTILKMDYQKKVVVSALRVFLEPNHLYDLLFEDLFQLLDLYDRYLCMAAIKDTLVVVFEQVTEANVHLVFDLYEKMDHLRELMDSHFMENMQMFLYWKSQVKPPLELIKDVEEELKARKDTKIPFGICTLNKFSRGTVFNRFPLFQHEKLRGDDDDVVGWGKIGFDDMVQLLSGNLLDYSKFCSMYQADFNRFQNFYHRSVRYPVGIEADDFRKMPEICAKYLGDPKRMKNIKPEGPEEGERKRKCRIRLSSAQHEPNPFEAGPSKERERQISNGNEAVTSISVIVEDARLALELARRGNADLPRYSEPSRYEIQNNIRNGVRQPIEMDISAVEEQIEALGKNPIKTNELPQQGSSSLPPNLDPNLFPGMASCSSSTPAKPREKLVFPKRSSQAKHKVADIPPPRAPAPPPWVAEISSTQQNVKSLKQIQKEEEEAQKVAKNKQDTSKSIPMQITPRTRKNTWQESPAGPSSASPGSFAAIMAEEQRRQNPEKKPAKPLEAVTMEERAMQELEAEYRAQFDGEAVISVSLAPKNE